MGGTHLFSERINGLEQRLAALEALILQLARPHEWGYVRRTDDLGHPANLQTVLRLTMEEALRRHSGNQKAAAKDLGVTPRMLNYRVQTLGLDARRRRRN